MSVMGGIDVPRPEGGATVFPRRDIRASAPKFPLPLHSGTRTQLLLSPHVSDSVAPQLQRRRPSRQRYRVVLILASSNPVSGLFLHLGSLRRQLLT